MFIDKYSNQFYCTSNIIIWIHQHKYFQKELKCNRLWALLKLLCIFLRYMFVCLFGVFRPTREFFTHSLVTGCKFWPMLGPDCHLAVRVFSVSHLLWHGTSVYNWLSPRTVTLTPNAERLAVELSLPVLTTWRYFAGFELQTFRFRDERFYYSLRHCRNSCRGNIISLCYTT